MGGISIDDFASGNVPSGDIVINSPTIRDYFCTGNEVITSLQTVSTTYIGHYAFQNTSNLKRVDLPLVTQLGTSVFQSSNIEIVNAPMLKTVGSSAFRLCQHLVCLKAPKLTSIPTACFWGDSRLASLSLASCSSISSGVFSQCDALKDIYLPNAESTYTGAPWGATNATIHYNTQFDENGLPILE